MRFTVDGAPVDLGRTYAYRGLMLSGVPNLAFCVGYTNASWTLRADLASRYVARLVEYMRRKRRRMVVPTVDTGEMAPEPLIGLSSGYVRRAVADFPKQGPTAPWRMAQNYYIDLMHLRVAPIAHRNLEFS